MPHNSLLKKFSLKTVGAALGVILFVFFLVWANIPSLIPDNGISSKMLVVIGVGCLMACLWVSEAIPIPATSLIPLAAFPLLGIADTKTIAPAYSDKMILLLMGGFMIATVIEKVNLHKRIALNVIYKIGTNPRQLLLGFMVATAFLSMWISNTATTLMMLPIALAVVNEIEKKHPNSTLATAFMLGIAYSASVGGVGTPIGTPPNLIMIGQYNEVRSGPSLLRQDIKDPQLFIDSLRDKQDPVGKYLATLLSTETHQLLSKYEGIPGKKVQKAVVDDLNKVFTQKSIYKKSLFTDIKLSSETQKLLDEKPNDLRLNRMVVTDAYPKALKRINEITFASWMAVGIPTVILVIAIVWFYMIVFFKFPKSGDDDEAKKIIESEIESLGSMTYPEKSTLILFTITSLMWIFRKNINLELFIIPGWTNLIGLEKFIDDTTIAIFMAIVMFAFPISKDEKLLDWDTANRIPWGMLLLFGGGIALARAFQVTGLSAWLGENLNEIISQLPAMLMVALICCFMTFLTEVTSNTAVTTVMMPILAISAIAIGEHPALLMMPAAISASFAFMLPVATAPNAIMYSTNRFSIATMARTGFLLNLIGIFIVTTTCFMLGKLFVFG